MKSKIVPLSLVAVAVSGAFNPALASPVNYYDLDGFKFTGYGRAVFGATDDRLLSTQSENAANGMNIIATAGNPYEKTGNLGNQKSQAELNFNYGVSKNDMNWVNHLKLFSGTTDYANDGRPASDYVFIDEWWVHGKGVFDSNPDAVIWMGKRYFGRYEASLNGFQHINNDGVGVGIENWDLGFAQLNVAVVKHAWGQYTNETCTSYNQWGVCQDDSEDGWGGSYYTLVTNLHSMEVTNDWTADIFGNVRAYYGSDKDMVVYEDHNGDYSTVTASDRHPTGYQLGFALKQGQQFNTDEIVFRYGNKVPTSSTYSWLHIPSHQIGGFWSGSKEIAEDYIFEYTYSHETAIFNDDVADAKTNGDLPYERHSWNQIVVRGTYNWNEKHATKIEYAYDRMDFEVNGDKPFYEPDGTQYFVDGEDGVNTSQKITLAHDIRLGSGFFDRPIIRFFVTYGQLDTETVAYRALQDWRSEDVSHLIPQTGKNSATTVGAMFTTYW